MKLALRAALLAGFATAAVLGGSGIAAADHVDQPIPQSPPWSRTPDGLTYCFIGHCESWDKKGNYVCETGSGPTGPICDLIMVAVRALPPTDIGDLVPHNIIP